ncbi:uncharacterized protein LOC122657691 isoform X2 [Telopea speciosissima]|uniref:uncharacterized protein LOC122657691 isoform X2 n=1 Tax=Telopea speciosissima TaxID=54955 RepID=UPI001CC6A04B|nr:uncharacterized protein LOC122657691 isoform X2 [Telopea speciosissima]
MLSVMNNECELDRKSDVAVDLTLYEGEHPDVIRVSEASRAERRSVARIDGTECLTTTAVGSEDSRGFPELVGGQMEAKAEVRFPDGEVYDLDSNGGNFGSVAEHVEPEKVGCVESCVSPDIDSRQMAETMDSRVSVQTDVPLIQDIMMEHETTSGGVIPEVSFGEMGRDAEATVEAIGSDFNSLYSKVDLNYETARALRYGFKIGDMVWGKVKSHPMWPGQIYNDAFASPSVRRTKREGHVLVAFFGDSSYGWFDPEDLVPFEPYYAEKSRQTNSRNFLKAVEEAVDEASRRNALGLACYCRSPFNFRRTSVQGYFAVDVDGYEPGGVYSVKQVKMARDNFQPASMLSFILQTALMPRSSEPKGIDWVKDKATVLAYRKAVYEEYDDTYAQAFGVQPTRPSRDSMGVLVQPEKFPFRAPLSGPLVYAESLGEKKSSTKPMKGKDQSKKDKYLLKRREGPNDVKAHHISEGCVSISVPSSFKEAEPSLAAGDYLLQKRESIKPHTPGKGAEIFSGVVSVPSQGGAGQEVAEVDKKPVIANFNSFDSPMNTNRVSELAGFQLLSQPAAISDSPVAPGGQEYGMQPLDEEICLLQEVKGRVNVDVVRGPISDGMHGSDAMGMSEYPGAVHQAFRQEEEAMVDVKPEEHVKVGSTVEGLEPPRMRIIMPSENHQRLDIVQEGGRSMPCLPSDVKHPAGKVIKMGSDKGMKAKKVLKRPGEELDSDKSFKGERKRKKKKKETCSETNINHQQKHLKTVKDGESMRKSAGKSIGIGIEPQRKVDASESIFPSGSLMTPSVVDMGNMDFDLPQLVEDLFSLALDPFHGVERNSPAIVRQVFLQFRSIVYQKSLILSPLTEAEPKVEPGASDQGNKSPAITGAVEVPPGDEGNQPSASRPTKKLFTPKDPTKGGRKRNPSERQEEISSKRLKKLKDLKSMTAEKKAGSLKTSEMQRDRKDVKDTGVAVSAKPIKPDSVKKPEPPLRVVEPTMLVMKFPPKTTLPSVPQLKARFVRFGPLDHSAIRVLWKSSTCRVVFMHKSHAHAAHDYAVRNSSSLFGGKVLYHLRSLEVPTQVSSDSVKRREDAADETTQLRVQSTNMSATEPRQAAYRPRPPQPAVQLKSCLKKPTGDEAGPIVSVPRESPRVKFMLGGEESSRGEQLVVSSSINNNGSNADGGASSLAMDVNSKNFQKVVPLPPLLPLPPRSFRDVHDSRTVQLPNYHNVHRNEVETRNNPNNIGNATTATTTTTAATNNVDISHEMLSLLIWCSDIVTDVKSSLGYVPYHPL